MSDIIKLQIQGVDAGDLAPAHYATCTTAGNVAAKTVTIEGLILGSQLISILFTNGFTVSSPTLNINNTGAKPIKLYGNAIPMGKVDNNTILSMICDGTNYNVISIESQAVPTSNAVDLGLPSGLLWCDHNVGASKPEEEGFFFSWGNVEGHNLNGQGTYDFGTGNDTDPYKSSSGATIGYPGSIAVGDAYDMARANMGAPWRLPTNAEFQELYNNCTNVWINQNGIKRTSILDVNNTYIRWDTHVTGIKLNRSSLKLSKGKIVALKATVIPTNASLKSVKWSSSNKKVATVDSSGKVKGISKGTATITATTIDGSKKATCKVTVTDSGSTPTGKSVAMYRLYNPNSGEHFYTSSASERDDLEMCGWDYEGVAWKAPQKSKTPVYRLYNPNSGDHHYTTSVNEKDNLIYVGWDYEGIGWYSDDNKGVPLYRLYNPNARGAGSHHYTTSKSEKNILVNDGWKYEGIAWYGMK